MGQDLTIIGSDADAGNDLHNASCIGFESYVTASNALVLGAVQGVNGGVGVNVGIGVTAPVQTLHVEGTARITDSDGTATTIMGRDADGDVSAITVGSGLDLTSGVLTTTGPTTAAWLLEGNTGTTAGAPSDDFIGTTDEEDFVFATDDQEWMRIIGETTNQGNVGIHTTSPSSGVLHVVDDASASFNTAIYGYVENGDVSKAVEGYSFLTNASTTGYGGYFFADAGVTGPTTNYGVYAEATGASTNYAGYFTGDVYCTGSYLPSDKSLKSNVKDLQQGLEIINQLEPKEYSYLTGKFPQMRLPEGSQFGFMAQDLQRVAPNLTKRTVQPAVDRHGQHFDQVDFTAVNYIGLIPVLVSAIQEQQEIIEDKDTRIVALEQVVEVIQERLASLGASSVESNETDVTIGFAGSERTQDTELHQNRPNPFEQLTTFTYTLSNSGQVELNIYSVDGQFVDNVVNQAQDKGNYRVEWDSKDIPGGIYFYVLTVDGIEWVKKAIRL